jgi:hypothetical protein
MFSCGRKECPYESGQPSGLAYHISTEILFEPLDADCLLKIYARKCEVVIDGVRYYKCNTYGLKRDATTIRVWVALLQHLNVIWVLSKTERQREPQRISQTRSEFMRSSSKSHRRSSNSSHQHVSINDFSFLVSSVPRIIYCNSHQLTVVFRDIFQF